MKDKNTGVQLVTWVLCTLGGTLVSHAFGKIENDSDKLNSLQRGNDQRQVQDLYSFTNIQSSKYIFNIIIIQHNGV